MAHGSLLWADLTADQLNSVRRPQRKGFTSRDVLAQLTSVDTQDIRGCVVLDLYVHALQYSQEQRMTDDQVSTLFSIVKEVHSRAVAEKLAITVAFGYLRDLLAAHSVQRPPFSLGVFTPTQMQRISDWMLNSYFRHYKLYQYTFTARVTLTASTHHPMDSVELPPWTIPPLMDAVDDKQHAIQVAEQQLQEDAMSATAKAAFAHAAEVDRLRRAKEEYEASIPDDIKERVAEAVKLQMDALRQTLNDERAAAIKARDAAAEAAAAAALAQANSSKPKTPLPGPK